MNPQYMPQQFRGPPQNFPPPGPQGFQNVPLDGPKPGLQNIPLSGPPQTSTPPSQVNNGIPSSFPPNMPPPSMRPIPSSQLPPGTEQRPPSRPQTNQFAPPPMSKPGDMPPPSRSPSQFQNGLNGQFPSTFSGSNQVSPQEIKPPVSGINQPNQVPSNQSHPGQPPFSGEQSFPGQPPLQGKPPGPGQFSAPPMTGPPPPGVGQPPPGVNQPPSGPLLSTPSGPGQPPLGQSNHFPGQQPVSGPPTSVSQPNFPGQPPVSGPPISVSQPNFPGQPPVSGQPTSMNQLNFLGQPPLPGQTNSMPRPGMPQNSQTNQFGQPLLPGQQQMPGQPGQQHPGQPPLPGHQVPGQPPLPGHQHPGQQPLLGQQHRVQPPLPGQQLPGQPSLQGQQHPGQPPLPGQQHHQRPTQYPGLPPMPSQQPQQMPGMPPLPGQYPGQQQLGGHPPMPGQYNPNQLSNQMQGMNLNGPRQYPGGPLRNGDPGPHMPPAMNQQQINGQQMRSPQQPGYPPMPLRGGPQSPSGYGQPSYAAQPPKPRLDPDHMPNPIQVTQDDQLNRSGTFCTNLKGQVPPLVTTNFIVNDQGNASPRFIRSTMYNVPITQDIMKSAAVPFSLVISPMARIVEQELPPPIVNFGELGPVRCIRCKAYMCPYMQFIDSGRRFQCLFCKATTDVPAEYFQHLDHTGQRMDRYERPELVLGTYEFVATADYCRNNVLPKPPAIIFVIDVSYNNVKSGLVNLLCSQMKDIIQNLPVDQGQEKSNMKVGFITYNSSVHFYNIKGTLAAPQMLVVGDTQEMFMPLLDGFLCTPDESEAVIDALMQQIPTMFGDTRETETLLLPAIVAGLEALKASECAGKLLVFHSSLPTAEAPGKLKNREDRKLLGTDKERTVLIPQIQAYNQLGQDCVAVGCSVDLFIFNNSYIDIATIGQVSRLTGGEVFKYTYFQADLDGERLIKDIITDISRPIAFDAIMRVRTSTGVRPTDFYGQFFMSNTTDMELAAIDCDKAVAVEIKHDDKLSEGEGVYIQAALLFTSCSGQRRLRIINLSLNTVSQMADLYRSCDLDTLLNYIAKQSCFKLLDNSPKAVKDSIVNRAAQILATYRKNCAGPSNEGQLILPECLKLLPLYANCLLKCDAIAGGADMTIDDRSYVMQTLMTMDVKTSVHFFYPRLIPLHDIEPSGEVKIPQQLRCSIEKMNEQGVYLLENGIHMFLWIGLGANPEFIQKVFGAPSAIQVDIDRVSLPELDNPLSLAVRTVIEEIRIQKHRCMRLTIIRQKEKLEPVYKHFLVEDQGINGSPSYVDFLCHMHKEIRLLLS